MVAMLAGELSWDKPTIYCDDFGSWRQYGRNVRQHVNIFKRLSLTKQKRWCNRLHSVPRACERSGRGQPEYAAVATAQLRYVVDRVRSRSRRRRHPRYRRTFCDRCSRRTSSSCTIGTASAASTSPSYANSSPPTCPICSSKIATALLILPR